MKNRSTVSVIVPSYNHDQYIQFALNSIACQSFKPKEIIVVDDGSTDDSTNRISDFAKIAKKAKIDFELIVQPNQGAHVALNRGLSIASGNWITILNSDDAYQKNRIETLLDFAFRKKSSCVFSSVRHIDENGSPLSDERNIKYFKNWYDVELSKKRPNTSFHFLYHNIGVTTGNLFLQKSTIEEIGSFNCYQTCHDYDYFLRAMQFTNVEILPKPLLDYRVHSRNTIGSDRQLENFEVINMVSKLFRDIVVNGIDAHPSAPWSKVNRKEFLKFFKNKDPHSAIHSALGFSDISDLLFK